MTTIFSLSQRTNTATPARSATRTFSPLWLSRAHYMRRTYGFVRVQYSCIDSLALSLSLYVSTACYCGARHRNIESHIKLNRHRDRLLHFSLSFFLIYFFRCCFCGVWYGCCFLPILCDLYTNSLRCVYFGRWENRTTCCITQTQALARTSRHLGISFCSQPGALFISIADWDQ